MGLFSFARRPGVPAFLAELGRSVVALRVQDQKLPAECVQIVFSENGQSRRAPAAGARGGEVAYCFHPGPYSVDVAPFAAAPEVGLRTRFAVDAADPRVARQRFDLYLFSEVPEVLTLASLGAAIERAVQDALSLGTLELPPCTAPEEWHAFRAGLNQLLYTRFGVTVDDCIPIDLGEQADYAAQLRARTQAVAAAPSLAGTPAAAAAAPAAPAARRGFATVGPPDAAPAMDGAPAAASVPGAASAAAHPAPESSLAAGDAYALRRLFLELPVLSAGLRALALPPGQALFLAHRSLLQRVALIALDVNTMPALELAAPSQPLEPEQQQRRARHTAMAVQALDQAWALLARMQAPPASPVSTAGVQPAPGVLPGVLLDEADRLVANLDFHLSQRRLVRSEEPSP